MMLVHIGAIVLPRKQNVPLGNTLGQIAVLVACIPNVRRKIHGAAFLERNTAASVKFQNPPVSTKCLWVFIGPISAGHAATTLNGAAMCQAMGQMRAAIVTQARADAALTFQVAAGLTTAMCVPLPRLKHHEVQMRMAMQSES